jgi:ketosteroid isomerase-like protein
MTDAAELARYSVERWNARDLPAVYATWDPAVVMRPDPYFPDSGVLVGIPAGRTFYEEQIEFMGAGRLEILEEDDLGDRCLLRIRQHVEAPASGIRSSYDWSIITTARDGRVVSIDFFIERASARTAAGLDDDAD